MFNSLCLIVENLRICYLSGSPTKFADMQFADQSKEICILVYLRNLRLQIEPKNLRIKKNSCKFATSVNDTPGQLPPVLTALAINLTPVSTGAP
jgi:hypothetical protein